jgi:hypothetical protein
MSDQLITRTKEDAVTLRWLQKATAQNDGRPTLSGVCKSNGKAVSSDGFRLHIAPTPEVLDELPDGSILRINDGRTIHKTANRVYPTEAIDGNFPDWEAIMPKDPPNLIIAFNPQYLREAIELPQSKVDADMVVLRFYTSQQPAVIQDMAGTHQAVLMPMYLGDKDTPLGEQARECDERLTRAKRHEQKELSGELDGQQYASKRLSWIRTHHPEVFREAMREA